jgi:activating signal cointegrator complex subunit 3
MVLLHFASLTAANNEHMYHSELFSLQASQCRSPNPADRIHSLSFTIPIFEPLPSQYFVRAINDR